MKNAPDLTLLPSDLMLCNNGTIELNYTAVPTGWSAGALPGGGALRAFPNAEGVGTLTRGGSGGTIYQVTNLNNSGAGSFREACEASGARIIHFNVSGIINLTSELVVSNPNITIAGQTSPGGIIVAGYRMTVNTNDFIMRHVRFRTGTHNNGGTSEFSRSFQVNGDGNGYPNAAYNVVADHCSFAWGTDQTVTVQEDAYDVTISWCAINEAHDNGGANHGFSMFFWGRYTDVGREYSVHHNYLSNSRYRNPEINYKGKLDFVNNVSYNSVRGSMVNVQENGDNGSKDEIELNVIGNLNRFGPNTSDTNKGVIDFYEYNDDAGLSPIVYPSGNIGGNDGTVNIVTGTDTSPFQFYPTVDAGFIAGSAFSFDESVTATAMTTGYATTVAQTAGATVPQRDAIDIRCSNDFDANTGRIIESTSYPSDWPDLATGAPSAPTDTNGDGIPDAYEIYKGLSVGAAVSTATAPSGYTWAEEYHNDLADGNWSIS